MNRKLIVTLLRKDIAELDMITEGFMEMNEYPKAIIQLAQNKIADIQSYIQQLENVKSEIETTVPDEHNIIENIRGESIETSLDNAPEEELTTEIFSTEEIVQTEEFSVETEVIEFVVEKENISDTDTDDSESDIEFTEVTEMITSTITQTKTTITEDTKRSILAEKINSNIPSRNDSLSMVDNSISSTHANKKITDIKQAISIGERFRFQRELFRGNGEDMNKTLNYINQLATLNEVQSFLQSKYGWENDNETVEEFYQLVKRKFM